MSVLAARRMHWTEAEYLSFENASATKHEYLDGEIFALAGAQPSHHRVASNTLGGLVALARGRGCGAFNSDQRIHVPPTGLYLRRRRRRLWPLGDSYRRHVLTEPDALVRSALPLHSGL